ncbi:hypothetical protein FORC4_1783 [Vibrio parahaemolyticus]|nr:hypothetical protein FORC4_1715 [Vibrio parahaemolyticus]ALM66756.1 hypothetical protein FORC4_1783 [Vibrio parahaemolyticus]
MFLVMAFITGFSLTSILVSIAIYLVSVWLLTPLTQVKCKYCDSNISKKAIKCPKCQSDLSV